MVLTPPAATTPIDARPLNIHGVAEAFQDQVQSEIRSVENIEQNGVALATSMQP
jgi:hypothetical protein